jgi:glycosyltransferase involved in cell wall biosynthesis
MASTHVMHVHVPATNPETRNPKPEPRSPCYLFPMTRMGLSVVAPAHNEAENVRPLVDEVGAALETIRRRWPDQFGGEGSGGENATEFVLVDDGSTDETRAIALDLQRDRPWLRVVAMTNTPPGTGNGQSAAFYAGFRAARGELVAVLDADLQNDPADLVRMVEVMQREGADFVQGDRSAARRAGDAWIRQATSIIGRAFRKMLLGDTIRDTGCSLRLMKREIAVRLPLEFKGMHRFIPVTARQLGYRVVEMPVSHRPRHAGETKYGMGITKRALPGLIDCFAVRWMRNRRRPVTCAVYNSAQAAADGGGEQSAAAGAGGASADHAAAGGRG